MEPQVYRLIVDWANLQPDPAVAANLALPSLGCMRDIPPCGPYNGIEAILQAVAARQKQSDGWSVEVVIYGVPAWAATPGGGCERPNIEPRSRAINDQGLEAYKTLIGDLHALGEKTGAELRFWAPWNEPNQVFFISPQRVECETSSPLVSPKVYAKIFRAAKEKLDELPGDQEIVLGELAGSPKKGKRAGTPGEFIDDLPKDVVCGADVFAQHDYAGSENEPIKEASAALDKHGCDKELPIWASETGVGDLRAGKDRARGDEALKEQCARYDKLLTGWSRNPRIKAAIQYTVREDPLYRVGLVNELLTRGYPTFDLLEAWSQRTTHRPPPLPDSCS